MAKLVTIGKSKTVWELKGIDTPFKETPSYRVAILRRKSQTRRVNLSENSIRWA